MAKNNPKSVVKSTFDNSFAAPSVSNEAWKRYKNHADSTELPLKDRSLDEKVNIKGFSIWIKIQTPKKNK